MHGTSLLPGYQHGKGIAIKVNLNNCGSCGDSDNLIDALMQPVNALIAGMLSIGVQAIRYLDLRCDPLDAYPFHIKMYQPKRALLR